jgi:hypothetical protein
MKKEIPKRDDTRSNEKKKDVKSKEMRRYEQREAEPKSTPSVPYVWRLRVVLKTLRVT